MLMMFINNRYASDVSWCRVSDRRWNYRSVCVVCVCVRAYIGRANFELLCKRLAWSIKRHNVSVAVYMPSVIQVFLQQEKLQSFIRSKKHSAIR